MTGAVAVTDDGGVRIIRMNRPEKKNALTLAMYADMTRALREADESDAIRCIMFAGAPGAFCAGNDIGDFLKARRAAACNPQRIDFLKALAHRRKPLVAAVAALPSASARPCCCTAITSSPAPMRPSPRRSSSLRSFRKRPPPCWRRCAWVMRAPSRCW